MLCSACEAIERLIIDGVAVEGFFTAKTVDNVSLIDVNSTVIEESLLKFLKCVYSGRSESVAELEALASACHINIASE